MEPIKEQKPTTIKKQYLTIVKVIVAMCIFLLGVPFVLIQLTHYYTNKGLAMDAYLMGTEYTQNISDFYQKNGTCPTNQAINTTITEEDVVDSIHFSTTSTNECSITLTLKTLGTNALDGKTVVLTKNLNTMKNEPNWQCYSNISSFYLPKDCKNNTQ